MVILLSPAKKLDFSETTCTQESKPFFTKKNSRSFTSNTTKIGYGNSRFNAFK